MGECPYCGASFDVDEFDDLEDCGDYVVGTSHTTCSTCGASLHVRGIFNWDGCLEVD